MKTVEVKQGVKLTAALIASNERIFVGSKPGDSLSNIEGLPLLISSGNINGCDNCTLTGNIYAEGKVDLSGKKLQGMIIGTGTTDGQGENVVIGDKMEVTDAGFNHYYRPMPGFVYPSDLDRVQAIPGTWRELE
jgi:hypothetical protein